MQEQQNISQRQQEAEQKMREAVAAETDFEKLDDLLWETLICFEGYPFYTAKGLEFTYVIKGYEMFVSRKDKSLTKATVSLAMHRAIEYQRKYGMVTGPKKLGTFGASYLYPVFIKIGVIYDLFVRQP